MEWWFASGHAADAILIVLVVETVWLVASGRAGLWQSLALTAPAMCFALALRAAMTGAGWPWLALPLTLAFPAHLADLRLRGWLGGTRR